jgi:hypothetical protein
MVAKKHEKKVPSPIVTTDMILHQAFMPQNLANLRSQYDRYVRIQIADGKKDEIGFVGYLNTVLILGLGVSAMKLIENENRLGIGE